MLMRVTESKWPSRGWPPKSLHSTAWWRSLSNASGCLSGRRSQGSCGPAEIRECFERL